MANLKHIGTKELNSDRLLLRKFQLNDLEDMYNNWESDAEVTKFMSWVSQDSIEETKVILEDWINNYLYDDFYLWAIVLKDINKPIGSISVLSHSDKIKKAAIGYCIGKKWWNKGIASEALRVVIDFLIIKVRFNRIEAIHDTNNPSSGKVMKRCGMQFEGILRQAAWNNQGIYDMAMYAILADDLFLHKM